MATPKKDMDCFDDLLTCTICLETFKVPKYLPCLHTFCESCIKTYIVSSTKKENEAEGFNCPVCRTFVSYDKRPDKPEAWASSLPMNHFVMSMLDKRAIQRSEKVCNSCQINNDMKMAISWCTICEDAFCEQCAKCHKSFKVSAKHKLISINEIQSGNSNLKISEVLSCEEHPEKIVEVYCEDHSRPCCTLCATLSHRKCEHVISIVKAATGIKQSELTTSLIKTLDERNTEISELVENQKENLAKVETTTEKLIKEVSTLKIAVIDHLDVLEEKIKTEMVSSKKHVVMNLTDVVNTFSSYKSTLNNWKSVLAGSIEHGSDQQCLMEVNKIGPKMTILENELKADMDKIKNSTINFVPSEHIAKFKTSVDSFGCVNIVEDKIHGTLFVGGLRKKVNFHNGEINILHKINAADSGQMSAIFIADCLFITSYSKSNVSKYSLDGKFLQALAVEMYPQDITQVDGTQVAISISGRNKILFVDTVEMKLLRTLDLSGISVYGLCCVEGSTFVVTCGSTMTWVNSSVKKLKQNTTAGSSFYVSTSDMKDFIYGDGDNSVSRVVGDTTKFTYTNEQLSSPRGIGIDFDGNIYIAGYSSQNIHQITNDGKLIRIIPVATFELNSAWTIRFAPNSNKFVVTCGFSGKVVLCEID
ncbi:E3 ubiquitin-protein ligase TRIM45-like [Mytilus galloprovincialis]|uniref:E3 ubiquitin-protein ligase TRIM45-like n=1 Tax=Mytilus galloprovincialis TaxID=29158 RepID=UPI003F7C6DA8